MRVAAFLLFGGGLSFTVGGAGLFTRGWNDVWYAPLERYLHLIAGHRCAWFWVNAFMIAAVVMNTAGLVVLAQLSSDSVVFAGAAAYFVGSIFWILVVSYRNTTSVWAADQLASTGRLPEAVAGTDLWANGLVPRWVAAVAIVFGTLGLTSRLPGASRIPDLRTFYEVPGLLHFPSAFIAIGLLLR